MVGLQFSTIQKSIVDILNLVNVGFKCGGSVIENQLANALF